MIETRSDPSASTGVEQDASHAHDLASISTQTSWPPEDVEPLSEASSPAQPVWRLATRVALIVGVSILLWLALITFVWKAI